MFFINNNGITDSRLNLALEEYCLRHLDIRHDYLLFYVNEPSVIIGRNQNPFEEVNHDYVRQNGIHVVRRISGGGAVYHDFGNLNFSFITRYDRSNLLNFKKFTAPVIKALRQMGVPAELNSRNDILADGRKISGNAQFSTSKSMVSHGTLLFDSKIEAIVKTLNVKKDKIESMSPKSVRSRVANISEFMSRQTDMKEFKKRLLAIIFKPFGGLREYRLNDPDWENINRLSEKKYRTWSWNYGRSPKFKILKSRQFDIGQIDTRMEVESGIIKRIKIDGDFPPQHEIDKLESLLTDQPYDADAIRNRLKDINLNPYWGPITLEMMIDYLV